MAEYKLSFTAEKIDALLKNVENGDAAQPKVLYLCDYVFGNDFNIGESVLEMAQTGGGNLDDYDLSSIELWNDIDTDRPLLLKLGYNKEFTVIQTQSVSVMNRALPSEMMLCFSASVYLSSTMAIVNVIVSKHAIMVSVTPTPTP